mmetsp:Transcript_3412/g.8496  ORF Transcript_3412/g.8496 Transcript_3412/m.8496 type:complete len:372 (-) Transcript_3412:326-1441(-)
MLPPAPPPPHPPSMVSAGLGADTGGRGRVAGAALPGASEDCLACLCTVGCMEGGLMRVPLVSVVAAAEGVSGASGRVVTRMLLALTSPCTQRCSCMYARPRATPSSSGTAAPSSAAVYSGVCAAWWPMTRPRCSVTSPCVANSRYRQVASSRLPPSAALADWLARTSAAPSMPPPSACPECTRLKSDQPNEEMEGLAVALLGAQAGGSGGASPADPRLVRLAGWRGVGASCAGLSGAASGASGPLSGCARTSCLDCSLLAHVRCVRLPLCGCCCCCPVWCAGGNPGGLLLVVVGGGCVRVAMRRRKRALHVRVRSLCLELRQRAAARLRLRHHLRLHTGEQLVGDPAQRVVARQRLGGGGELLHARVSFNK